MPEQINKYLITLSENVETTNNNTLYTINAVDEINAIKQMLSNYEQTNYNLIFNILFDIADIILYGNDLVNVLSRTLKQEFIDNKLHELEYINEKIINFLKFNINDLTIIFNAYINIQFIKIEIIN